MHEDEQGDGGNDKPPSLALCDVSISATERCVHVHIIHCSTVHAARRLPESQNARPTPGYVRVRGASHANASLGPLPHSRGSGGRRSGD